MILGVLSKDDCEQVRLWRNNQCLETLRTPYPLTKEMQEDFYRDVVCNRKSPHRYWGIWRQTGDDYGPEDSTFDKVCGHIPPPDSENITSFLGMGGLTNIEWENSQAEISLIINPALQRQGHGGEAVRLILDQAFNYMGLQLVYGECYMCNPANEFWRAIAVSYDGTALRLSKGKFWNGQHCGTLYFNVNRDDFRKVHSPVQPT